VPDTKKDPTQVNTYGAAWFADWSDALRGWSDQKKSGRTPEGAIDFHYWPLPTSYYVYGRAALALCGHLPGGPEAWTRCEETIAETEAETGWSIDWASDPTWAIVPP
jgi:hypothetical protein